MPLKTIHIQNNIQRAVLIIGAVVCAVAVIFSVKWSFGHAISIRAEHKEVAAASTVFAPDDPQTHYSSAVLHEKSLSPEDWEKSVAEYEKAAALSPNDYLLWLALGKARERNGDPAGAEKAFRRALELAPNYAETHWTLGNNLLRQGNFEAGFDEIRTSAVSSDKFVIPAIATAWQILDGDIARIKNNIGDSAKLNAYLAVFLVNQQRFEDAFEIWNSLSPEMKSETYLAQTEEIYNRFVSAGKYRFARRAKSSIGKQDDDKFLSGFTDGGFENNVKKQKTDFFDWQIGDGSQPLIGFDDKIKHGGSLSLVIIFNSPNGQDFRPLSQLIAVEAGKSYRFEGFYKSELKTSSTLRWEVLNASDRTLIAETETIEQAADWTKFGADFTVPENAEAVIINLAREKCNSTICPITGKVWFDDFTLNEK